MAKTIQDFILFRSMTRFDVENLECDLPLESANIKNLLLPIAEINSQRSARKWKP